MALIAEGVYEMPGSLQTERNRSNSTEIRKWLVRADKRDDATWYPSVGTTSFTHGLGWPASWRDNLICSNLREDPVDSSVSVPEFSVEDRDYQWWQVTATYAYMLTSVSLWKVTWRLAGDMMNIGPGRIWVKAGTPIGQDITIPVPTASVSFTRSMISAAVDIDDIMANYGKINASEFTITSHKVYHFPAGTLLFENADIQPFNESFDLVSFNFKYSTHSFQQAWRLPQQDRDDAGNLLWENGQPVYVAGVAGTAGWDSANPPFFETSATFETMMGML